MSDIIDFHLVKTYYKQGTTKNERRFDIHTKNDPLK